MVRSTWLIFIVFNINMILGSEVTFKVKGKKEAVVGEFLGTYMNHVHILINNEIEYFSCKDIGALRNTSNNENKMFSFNCGENTISEEILFPPELDPMTGEWIENIPDIFNLALIQNKKLEKKREEIAEKTKPHIEINENFNSQTQVAAPFSKSPNKEIVPKTNALNTIIPGLDTEVDNLKKEEAEKHYLTEKEIRVLVQKEIEKILGDEHFVARTKKIKNRKQKDKRGVYDRYYSNQITKKEFVRITGGREPIELLEANLISQQEYDEAIASPMSSLKYMQMFGPSITLKRKPEYFILPGIIAYAFLMIVFSV